MEKLTAIIPTGNEEHNIREVLESVSFADEIMVVDSFSTDQTVTIAKEYTDFVIQREYKYSASQKTGPFRKPVTSGFYWLMQMSV